MKQKPIIADPLALYRLGLRCLADVAALVHLGRCGLIGSVRPAMADHLGMPYETLRSAVDRLEELKLVTGTSNNTGRGKANRYVVTTVGWDVLTAPADLEPFGVAQTPLHISGKEFEAKNPTKS